MKRAALLIVLAACTTRPPASAPAIPAPAAAAAVDAATLARIQRVEGLVAQQPTNVAYLYVLATYYDAANDAKNVVRLLTRLDELSWGLGLGPDSFRNSSASPAFQAIAAKLESRETEARHAKEAFTFPKEREVNSEGIAYDPVDDVFYFSGGAATLLRVTRNGEIRSVAIEPVGKKFGHLGMHVDAERRQLWAVSAVFDPEAPADEQGKSVVSVYDLRDARLLRRVMIGSAAEPAFLNDLTLLRDGTAFVTDSVRHQVVRLAPGTNAFETWAAEFRSPNGIVVSADERTLFVADFRGVNQLDLETKSRKLLETSTPLNGIDGLAEHRGALIGIHNVLGRPRVVRIHPSESNRVELLESKNPLLNVPATGVVAGDEFFFLANLGQKNADGHVLKIAL